jgi:hypothetical protein
MPSPRDRLVLATACVVGCLAACDAPAPPPTDAAPPRAPTAAAPSTKTVAPIGAPSGATVFVDVAKEAGLTAANHTGIPDQKDWIASGIGGGAIVLDYDQDGLMDLVVVDGTMLTEKGDLEYDDAWRTRVYHNDGGLKFTDVTAKSGVDVKGFGVGGASCDYDGDGWPDFYLCGWGCNRLFHNRGDGTFEDVTDKAGVRGAPDDFSTGCCWGDVNGDGIPDLYVANYLDQRAFIEDCRRKNAPARSAKYHGARVYVGPWGLAAQKDRLYLGNGDGTFREVTDTNLGPQKPPRFGFQPVMTDVDDDGDLDIYVANDNGPNTLWINDGRGKFVDRCVEAGCAFDADLEQQASMGVDAADFNRDGRIDLFVTNLDFDHNTLYVNLTGGSKTAAFADLSGQYGVAQPSYMRVSWGTRFLDYDGDGELDLFVACGHVYGEADGFTKTTGASYRQRCLLLHGKGPPSYGFADVSDASGPALSVARVWRGAAFADFDNDGDLDVFVTALNDVPALLRNDVGNKNAFLVFRLIGKGKLRDPCGARVTVWLADGRPHMEELHHGASFCCDNDPRLFFGLGAETSAKRVDIRWPNGETQSFTDVAARKFYVVTQGKNELVEDKR